MKQFKNLNLILVMALGLLVVGCKKDPESTGFQYPFDDMAQSMAYEAYSENPNTKTGLTMIQKPEGSVARGHKPHLYGKNDFWKPEVSGMKNPYRGTSKNLERGKYLYDNFCIQCHGEKGMGNGTVIEKFAGAKTMAFNSEAWKILSDGVIFHVITKGFGRMPSHENQLSIEDRWMVTMYVKKLQQLK